MTELDMSGVSGASVFTGEYFEYEVYWLYIQGKAKASTLTGLTGADTLVGGAGADTITGATGIDTLTGGGADTFVYAANAAGAVVSSLAASDTITDFTSGTDKIQIAQTLTAFLGNYTTVSQAQAAAAADGRGNLAYFVTGEELLCRCSHQRSSSDYRYCTKLSESPRLRQLTYNLGRRVQVRPLHYRQVRLPFRLQQIQTRQPTTAKDDTITFSFH